MSEASVKDERGNTVWRGGNRNNTSLQVQVEGETVKVVNKHTGAVEEAYRMKPGDKVTILGA
jgi:protein involved in polysaccharide export with SLBB domain